MPAAKSFPPELRRRNRLTLLALFGIVAICAATPVAVRLLTRPIPAINQTARDLFPPPAGQTPHVTLYAPPAVPLTAEVAAMLADYDAAVQTVFPESARPIEIALLADEMALKQVWIQIFSRDDRSEGVRGVGRATFVLYDARGADGVSVEQQSAEVGHLIGRALLEQKLEERLRLVSEPYAWLVAEMMAVALQPGILDAAWSDYIELRESNEPLTEKAWLGGFSGAPDPLVRATTRLIAGEFITSRRSTEFITLVRDGYDLETAFRAVASGLVTNQQQVESAPPQSVPGTSFDAMVERIENRMKSRRRG